MLIQFRFKNFRSFRDDTTLDMTAIKITEFSERVFLSGGEKVLPVAAIYGANASGKSNVYAAFEYMSNYVAYSLGYADEGDRFEKNKPTPFLLQSDTAHAASEFEVFFTVSGDGKDRIYNYGFCVDHEGVSEEWLNYRSKTSKNNRRVFYRNRMNNGLELSGLPAKSKGNIEAGLEPQTLIVSLGAKTKVEICKLVRDWFMMNEMTDYANPLTNYTAAWRLPDGFVDNRNVQRDVVDYFSTFDEQIKDFRIEKIQSEEGNREEYFRIGALHPMIDSGEMAELPFGAESAGTLKMFSLYPELRSVMEKGSVFFVDELNARLHPLLVRNLLLLFLNPALNGNHAQLVFTTHDLWQLSNQLFRRDEIWFTDKDKQGVSTLYSLADFVDEDGDRIRKDENYAKNYALGKYGAIPILKEIIMNWEKE